MEICTERRGSMAADESLGTVFRFDRPSTYEVVHAFSGQGRTLGSVVEGSDGRLYGTTSGQSVSLGNNGGVFGVDLSGANFAMVHELTYFDGASPKAGLMRASDGMLYGTTWGGGVERPGSGISRRSRELPSLDR